MRAFFLTVAFVLCAALSFAQGIIGLLNKSEDFIDLMNQEKFEDAQSFFDESLKAKITPNALMAMWTSVIGQSGKLTGVDGESSAKDGEYVIVTVRCKFQNGPETFRFVFNTAEKLVGLFRMPKSTADTYAAPAYADTSKFIEKQVMIQTPGHTLAGIVTVPKNATSFPIVVLVHGSGPSDMDETVGPNKPFKDLAAGLAAKGIATLRYVKRTLLYANEFGKANTVKEEVLDDAVQAIAVAKTVAGVNKSQVYVLGHSLGGMLAPRIAGLVPDLAGIILAAAPARSFTDLMEEQNMNMYSHSGDTTNVGRQRLDNALKMLQVTRIKQLPPTIKADSVLLFAPAAYWIDINNYDQVASARKFKNKILVIQGQNDIQVSEEDYNLWKAALGSRSNATFKLYPDLDHLLSAQPGKDWSGRYSKQVNVAEYLVNDIAAWIKAD